MAGRFNVGEKVQVRVNGQAEWVPGVVMLTNRDAMALRCQRTLGVGAFAIMRDRGGFYAATMLIYLHGGKWIDIASGERIEVQRVQPPDAMGGKRRANIRQRKPRGPVEQRRGTLFA